MPTYTAKPHSEFFEWDGTHFEGTLLWDWIMAELFRDSTQTVNGFCDLFNQRCCSLVIDGQNVRIGDRIYNRNGVLELVRGDTEPLICPTHGVEHSGTGPFLCMTTGKFA